MVIDGTGADCVRSWCLVWSFRGDNPCIQRNDNTICQGVVDRASAWPHALTLFCRWLGKRVEMKRCCGSFK